jgi:hypothetical protein
MKPFNFEEFKAGRPAIADATNGEINWRFVGLLSSGKVCAESSSGILGVFEKDGSGVDVAFDLIHMAPQKKKMWVAVCPDASGVWATSAAHESKDQLLKSVRDFTRWQICEIEVEV